MLRTILTMALLSATLSGCLSYNPSNVEDPLDASDSSNPDSHPTGTSGAPDFDGPADAPSRKEYSGTSRLTQAAVCPPAVPGCWGYWRMDNEDTFHASGNVTAIVTVFWNETTIPYQELTIFIFESPMRAVTPVLARVTGTSPITIVLDEEALEGHQGSLGVGIRDNNIVAVQWEQEAHWTATVEPN